MALCIEVDEQHALTQLRQCGAKVYGGSGLAHTPLLHRDGDRSGQECSESSGQRFLLGSRRPSCGGPVPAALTMAAVFVVPLIAAVVGGVFAVVVARQYMS